MLCHLWPDTLTPPDPAHNQASTLCLAARLLAGSHSVPCSVLPHRLPCQHWPASSLQDIIQKFDYLISATESKPKPYQPLPSTVSVTVVKHTGDKIYKFGHFIGYTSTTVTHCATTLCNHVHHLITILIILTLLWSHKPMCESQEIMLVYHLPSLPQIAVTGRASPSAGQFSSFKTRTNRV